MIFVVIPVFNRKKFTRDCLISLRNQTYVDFKIIIVDDGSTDGTDTMLAGEFPEVTVLRGTGNLYWTASINLGIRYALENGADYIMTLNNDTVPFPDFMEKMVYWSKEKPDALLGALDIDAVKNRPHYGGEIVKGTWARSTYLLNELKEEQQKGIHEVSLFPGRGLLIPRCVFRSVGLFEERKLPHYMADYDFTCLARRNGFKIYCNYDARLSTYPNEGGDYLIRKNKSVRNYFNHLFSIKGGGNLRNFTVYTLRNSPPLLVPLHLMKGYAQRIFGYLIK